MPIRNPPRLKLLFIAPIMPGQGGNGLAMRAAALLDALARHFDITLYVVPVGGDLPEVPVFVTDRTIRVGVLDVAAGLEAQAALIERVADRAEWRRQRLAYPRPWTARFSGGAAARHMAAWIGDTRFDAVHVMRLYLAPLGLRYLRDSAPPAPPAILDLDEDDALVEAQFARLHARRGEAATATQAQSEAGRYASLARASLAAFHTVLTCAAADAERLAPQYPAARFAVVPNVYPAIPAPSRGDRPFGQTPRLLLVGNFRYLPNQDAAAHLARDILPLLLQSGTDIEIDFVGTDGTPAMLGPGAIPAAVNVHGFVPDVGPWYDRADVAVVPLRAGGGTRIKILEAFAHRVPVVSTRIGAEGLDAVHDQHLLLADDPADFARACLRLHRCPALRTRLTAQAAALLDSRYSPACIAAAVDAIVRTLSLQRTPTMTDRAASPPVRAEGLDINVLDDGFVVYHTSHDRVHYLNPTAGLLLELCNGVLDEAELAERLGRAWDLPEPPYEDVAAGLRDLRAQGLIL